MLEVFKNLLTTKGAALHARTLEGEKIQITKFVIGNGIYSGTETDAVIVGMTALRSPKNTYGISDIQKVNDTTCRITLIATNELITQGYYVTEIGVYAKGEDNKEILYAVIIADPSKPDWMSAYNSVAPGALRYYDYVSVGNASNVTIMQGSGGVITLDDIATIDETKEYLGIKEE